MNRLIKDGVIDRGSSKLDAWKKPFHLRCDEQELYVTSAGPDGKLGTNDDITVPEDATEG